MKKLMKKLTNTIAYLQIEATTHPAFFLILYALAAFQSLATISKQSSLFYLLVSWSEPSTYLDSSIVVQVGFTLLFAFLFLFLLRFINTQPDQKLSHRRIFYSYLDKFIFFNGLLWQKLILIPFIRSCFLELTNESDQSNYILAIIGLLFCLMVFCPLFLINSLNTNILTPQTNKKINVIQAEFLYNLFRILIAAISVLNNLCTLLLGSLFAAGFLVAIFKRPIFFYDDEKIKKGLISAVSFVCLCRLFSQIVGSSQPSFLILLLGIIAFISLIQKISEFRVLHILKLEHPTVYQIKLLIFLVGQNDKYLHYLQYFILKHHRQCSETTCNCKQVVDCLVQKKQKSDFQSLQTCWYRFISSYIANQFHLDSMLKLTKSALQAKIQKYNEVIFDLAEIYLFKLSKISLAYFTMKNYYYFLEEQGLKHCWNSKKFKIVTYYLQQTLQERIKQDISINTHALNYMNFQEETCKLFKLIIKAARKAKKLWEEINKREPNEEIIIDYISQLGKNHQNICDLYHCIVASFIQSSKMLNPLLTDYLKSIMNILPGDFNHIIDQNSLDSSKHQTIQRIQENMQIFSYDSETPLCCVSVQKNSFGKIIKGNRFFNKLKKNIFGEVENIEEFIIPEMRQFHKTSMKQMIESDQLSLQNKSVLFLDKDQNLLSAKVLVQIVPSLVECFRFIVFFKKIYLNRRIVAVRNRQIIAYKSLGYRQARDLMFSEDQLMTALKQVKFKYQSAVNIRGQLYHYKIIRQFQGQKNNLLFIEITQTTKEEENKVTSEIQAKMSTWRTSVQIKTNALRKSKLSLILNHNTQKKSNKNQNSLEEKNIQAQRKLIQSIKQAFASITGHQMGKKIERKINIWLFLICLLLIAFLIACIIVKQSSRQKYLKISQSYAKFNQWALTIGKIAIDLKLLNLYSYQNMNSTYYYEKLINEPNLNELMTTAMQYYNSEDVDETWKFLQLNSNGSFTEGSQSYFASTIDYLQNPLLNLQKYQLQDFNFSFSLDYLTKPLTPTQIHFHTFVTNAIYFFLPKLRELEFTKLSPLKSKQNQLSSLVILSPIIILAAILTIIIMMLLFRRVLKVLRLSRRFVQLMSEQCLAEKKLIIQQFACKYSFCCQEKVQEKKALNKNSEIEKKQIKKDQIEEKFSEAELPVVSCIRHNESILSNTIPSEPLDSLPSPTIKKKQQSIFQELTCFKSYCKTFLILIISISPLLLFGIYFILTEVSELSEREILFINISGTGMVKQDANLIRLYTMQLGVYNYSLENYLSITKQLAVLIYGQFYVLQVMLSSVQKYTSSKSNQFLKYIQYADICQLDQNGFFSANSNSFPGRGDYDYCSSISNGALMKGYVSALLTYLQGANNLFLANTMSVMYSPEQKLSYLNSKFFTETTKLINYFDVIMDQFEHDIGLNLKNVLDSSLNTVTLISALLIVLIVLLLIFFRRYFIRKVQAKLQDASRVLNLISVRTIMENERLKNLFEQHLQEIKELK